MWCGGGFRIDLNYNKKSAVYCRDKPQEGNRICTGMGKILTAPNILTCDINYWQCKLNCMILNSKLTDK